jgi:hypothetical protein
MGPLEEIEGDLFWGDVQMAGLLVKRLKSTLISLLKIL